MVDELGWSDCLGEEVGDGGAVINGDRWMTFSNFCAVGLGVFLLDFLDDFVVLGVFMFGLKKERKKECWW